MAITVHIDNLTLGGKIYNTNDVILNPSPNAIRVARSGLAYQGVVMLTETGDTSQHDRILINEITDQLGVSGIGEIVIPRYILKQAMVGDMAFAVYPDVEEIKVSEATGKRLFTIVLETAGNDTHNWYSAALDAEVTTDSTDGTVTIVDVDPAFADGVCKIEVEYAGDWLVGEKATLTVKAATILGYAVAAATGETTIIADA